jgi:DNA ligase-associated metallophosphoesterase
MPAPAVRARLAPSAADPLQGAIAMSVAGADLLLLSDGAVWWEAERTLVVSDLHLEKGSRMAMRGQFVPPYDTGLTLSLVERLAGALMPDRVISLGDAFDDVGGADRLDAAALGRITAMQARSDWIWISGNHDPLVTAAIGGIQTHEVAIGPLVFRHAPRPGQSEGEIAGHLHPAARVFLGPKSVRRRCFAGDGTRLILPAIGAYTGGLSVMSDAFAGLFRRDTMTVGLLGDGRVYAFPRRMLSV